MRRAVFEGFELATVHYAGVSGIPPYNGLFDVRWHQQFPYYFPHSAGKCSTLVVLQRSLEPLEPRAWNHVS